MGSWETERPLGEVFDSVAEDFDMFRRGYPAVLVDAAIQRGSLVNGSRFLRSAAAPASSRSYSQPTS